MARSHGPVRLRQRVTGATSRCLSGEGVEPTDHHRAQAHDMARLETNSLDSLICIYSWTGIGSRVRLVRQAAHLLGNLVSRASRDCCSTLHRRSDGRWRICVYHRYADRSEAAEVLPTLDFCWLQSVPGQAILGDHPVWTCAVLGSLGLCAAVAVGIQRILGEGFGSRSRLRSRPPVSMPRSRAHSRSGSTPAGASIGSFLPSRNREKSKSQTSLVSLAMGLSMRLDRIS